MCCFSLFVGLGIDAVELAGFDEGVDGGGPFASGIRSCEQPVPTAECYATDGLFGGIVVDLERAVIEISAEDGPASQGITHRFGQLGLGRNPGMGCFDPCPEGVEKRAGLVSSDTVALIRRFAANGVFDGIQNADAVEGFRGRVRRLVGMADPSFLMVCKSLLRCA